MKIVNRLVVLAALLLVPALAHAHGGEDHGEAQPAPAAPGANGKRVAYGQSDASELLLKLAPPVAGQDASLLVFLSDFATNAPIDKAKIELELAGAASLKVVAEPTNAPGTYHALAKVPPGKYSVVATIEAGDQVDLVEIKELDLTHGPAAGPVAEVTAHSEVPWTGIGLGVGALALVGLVVALIRRRSARGRLPTSAAILLLVVTAPLVARGHGGEDHGEAAPAKAQTALPSGGVYMAKESQFLLGVRTERVAERETGARVEAVGRVVPRIDGHAAIAAPQPGRIAAVAGKPLPFLGDKVKKGQPLFVIEQTLGASESGALKSQALQARGAAAQARARRDQAQRELERRKSLQGVVAEKDIQQAELEVELANRDLQVAEQQAALFGGGGLQRLTVTAPIDGIIADAKASLGEQVAADQEVYTIIEPSTLWVEADIFEADVPQIEQAGAADVRVEGYDKSFTGKVYRVGQTVDPGTRTVKVILSVDNAGGSLRPGMFARVAVAAGERGKALTVPDAAVVEEGGRRFVYVHVAPEEFVRREVVLGARDGDYWPVKAGVKKGERVVTQGTYQLRTSR